MVRKNRRNFLPTLVVNALFWGFLIIFMIKNSPFDSSKVLLPVNIIIFFILFTLTLTLTLALLFGNTRRGFFLALWTDSLFMLQLIKQASLFNLILTAAIAVVLDLFFSSKKRVFGKKFNN